jgi:hypothetical protein
MQIESALQQGERKTPLSGHYFYADGKVQTFPGDTKGVFYFHHVAEDNIQPQLRFRLLCNTMDEFPHGENFYAFLEAAGEIFL